MTEPPSGAAPTAAECDPSAAQHPLPPSPRRRTGRVWALALCVVAAASLAVVLPLVLRSRVLDRNAVQRDVAAQFQQHEGVALRLRCAEFMELTTGATYACAGTTAQGEHVSLRIRVTDGRTGRYTWSEVR